MNKHALLLPFLKKTEENKQQACIAEQCEFTKWSKYTRLKWDIDKLKYTNFQDTDSNHQNIEFGEPLKSQKRAKN